MSTAQAVVLIGAAIAAVVLIAAVSFYEARRRDREVVYWQKVAAHNARVARELVERQGTSNE